MQNYHVHPLNQQIHLSKIESIWGIMLVTTKKKIQLVSPQIWLTVRSYNGGEWGQCINLEVLNSLDTQRNCVNFK